MKNKKLTLEELTQLYEKNPEEFREYISSIPSDEVLKYGVMYLNRAKRLLSEVKSLMDRDSDVNDFYKKFEDSYKDHLN